MTPEDRDTMLAVATRATVAIKADERILVVTPAEMAVLQRETAQEPHEWDEVLREAFRESLPWMPSWATDPGTVAFYSLALVVEG